MIIGDFDNRVYTFKEAKDAVDHHHLIRLESNYIVLRDCPTP